jgi:hypothetical protein
MRMKIAVLTSAWLCQRAKPDLGTQQHPENGLAWPFPLSSRLAVQPVENSNLGALDTDLQFHIKPIHPRMTTFLESRD